jgi:hypothetical protein
LAIGLWPSEDRAPRPDLAPPIATAPAPPDDPADDPRRERHDPPPPIRSGASDGVPRSAEARSGGAGTGSPSRSGTTQGIAPTEEEPAPELAPLPRALVALSVNASPWAEVELDGRPIGRTPQRALSLRAGRHVLVLRCPPLGREVRHAFVATPGRPLVLVADLSADPPVVRSR